METKKLLIGGALIGASVFILPSLISGDNQSLGGGGASVGAVGLPSGLGGLDSSTKKESSTPIINIYESALPSPTDDVKKESSTPTYTGDLVTDIANLPEGASASTIPYVTVSPDADRDIIVLKKEPSAPTSAFTSVVSNVVVKPVSTIKSFFSRWF